MNLFIVKIQRDINSEEGKAECQKAATTEGYQGVKYGMYHSWDTEDNAKKACGLNVKISRITV